VQGPDDEGINFRKMAKRLYHDSEQMTVYLTRTKH